MPSSRARRSRWSRLPPPWRGTWSGARIFVGLEDIRQFYDEELVPQLVERGDEVPPIEEVREAIRTLLREQRKNDELERWTTELLQEADIEDYFESAFDALPERQISIETGSS